MPPHTFAVLAEPTRRQILDELCTSERSVGDLVDALSVSQPTMSKHLKVLRDAGFVSCRVAAQRRIYRIEAPPFERLDEWLDPYRRLWTGTSTPSNATSTATTTRTTTGTTGTTTVRSSDEPHDLRARAAGPHRVSSPRRPMDAGVRP
jgi:DNA-binding transcriptional ArsR family regulator